MSPCSIQVHAEVTTISDKTEPSPGSNGPKQKQNNNIYNGKLKTQNGAGRNPEVIVSSSSDIQVDVQSGFPTNSNCTSSRNESRRSTITYDFAESSVRKSPTSGDNDSALKPTRTVKSHSFRHRLKDSKSVRRCRRASSGLL